VAGPLTSPPPACSPGSPSRSRAGVSIFAISTYDTDHLLVKAAQWRHARDVLVAAGHDAPAFPQ
jgi:hypothetical protein